MVERPPSARARRWCTSQNAGGLLQPFAAQHRSRAATARRWAAVIWSVSDSREITCPSASSTTRWTRESHRNVAIRVRVVGPVHGRRRRDADRRSGCPDRRPVARAAPARSAGSPWPRRAGRRAHATSRRADCAAEGTAGPARPPLPRPDRARTSSPAGGGRTARAGPDRNAARPRSTPAGRPAAQPRRSCRPTGTTRPCCAEISPSTIASTTTGSSRSSTAVRTCRPAVLPLTCAACRSHATVGSNCRNLPLKAIQCRTHVRSLGHVRRKTRPPLRRIQSSTSGNGPLAPPWPGRVSGTPTETHR